MSREDPVGDFERWLDRELPVAIATAVRSAEPPPSPSARALRPSGRGVARLGARGAAALCAIALAAVGGGAALATGTPNPVTWGQSVVQAAVSVTPVQHTPAVTPEPPSVAPRTPASTTQTPAAAGTASPDQKPGQAKHQGSAEATPPAGSGHAARTHDPPGKAKGQKPDQ